MLGKILIVMRGVVVAQLIGFLALPIMARLFPVAAFGEFQLYQSVMSLAIGMIGLRYDLAVVSVKTDRQAMSVVQLATVVNIALALLACLAIMLMKAVSWSPALTNSSLSGLGVGISVFMAGMIQTYSYILTRNEQYTLGSNVKIAQSIAFAIAGVSLGYFLPSNSGVVFADIFQRIFAAALLIWFLSKRSIRPLINISPVRLVATAKRHRALPLVAVPTGVLTAASIAICPMMAYALYGADFAGQYGLFERSLILPLNLVALAVSQVTTAELALAIRNQTGDDRTKYWQLLKRLSMVAIIPALALSFIGPWAFIVIFGEKWSVASAMCSVFAISAFASFVASAAGLGLQLIEKTKTQLIWEICRLGSLLFGWSGAYFLGLEALTAIELHFAISALFSFSYIVLFDLNLKKRHGGQEIANTLKY